MRLEASSLCCLSVTRPFRISNVDQVIWQTTLQMSNTERLIKNNNHPELRAASTLAVLLIICDIGLNYILAAAKYLTLNKLLS